MDLPINNKNSYNIYCFISQMFTLFLFLLYFRFMILCFDSSLIHAKNKARAVSLMPRTNIEGILKSTIQTFVFVRLGTTKIMTK